MAELDIFTDTTADDTTWMADAFAEAYQEADAMFTRGEDGFWYNQDGERVYAYNQAGELGDVSENYYIYDPEGKGLTYSAGVAGVNEQGLPVQYLTEAEIRAQWDAEEGMGITKGQFDSFDEYFAYIQEVDALVNSPEYLAQQERRNAIVAEAWANMTPQQIQEALKDSDGRYNYTNLPPGVQEQIDAELGDYEGVLQQQWQDIRKKYDVEDVYRSEEGDVYQWNGYAYEKTFKAPQADFMDYVKLGGAILVGAIAGPAAANAFGGGFLGGAIGGATGSALSQIIVNGEVDPTKLAQAALTGGFGALANAAIAGELAGTDLDNAIWDLAGQTGMSYEQTARILEGVVNGTVTGSDLANMVGGAISGWSSTKMQEWLRNTYGDTVDIDNWFREGDSNIPVEAFDPVFKTAFQAAVDGGVSDSDLLNMAFDYFKAGGDIDFTLPGTPDAFFNWLTAKFPEFQFKKGDWGIEQDESGRWVVTGRLPEVDGEPIDLEIPKPECLEGESWSELLQKCVPDLPKIEDDLCDEGQILNEMGVCVDIELPKIEDDLCDEGQILNEMGVCVDLPKIEDDLCDEGQVLNELGVCVDLPKIEDDLCDEGQVLNELGVCVDLPEFDYNPCDEGQVLNELGLCEDIDLPSTSGSGINVDWKPIKVDTNLYTPVSIPGIRPTPKKDYVAALDGLFSRNLPTTSQSPLSLNGMFEKIV